MKKIFFLLPVLFIFVIACNNDKGTNSKDITKDRDEEMDDSKSSSGSVVGKWHIVDYVSASGERPEGEELKNMRSSTIEFTRDGSYIAISKDPDGERKNEYGTYRFDAKYKTLETVEDGKDGESQTFDVKFSGRNKMVLSMTDGKITLEKD